MPKRILALVAILALVLTACGGGEAEPGREKLTVALDWFINPDHAGIVAAQAEGFFDDEGLEVTLEVPADPTNPPKFAATGRVDLAISYQPDILLARAEGLPIVGIAAIVPVPLNSIQVLKTSGIGHPRDLAGKTIGSPGIPANSVYLQTILRQVGVDPSSVKEVDVGFELLPALVGGKVDAIIGAYWNIEAVNAELLGHPVDIFHLEDFGVPTYDELVFITSESNAKKKADVFRRFIRAVAKGHQFVVDFPDETVDLLLEAAPELQRDATERQVKLLVPLWQSMETFGQMDEGKWQRFADFLFDNKLVKEKLDASDAITTKLVE